VGPPGPFQNNHNTENGIQDIIALSGQRLQAAGILILISFMCPRKRCSFLTEATPAMLAIPRCNTRSSGQYRDQNTESTIIRKLRHRFDFFSVSF